VDKFLLTDYSYIALFFLIATGFAMTTILLPAMLGKFKIIPHSSNPDKYINFECGLETIGKTWIQFNFRYYFYALLFLTIDVLVVFLYPWAVSLKTVGYSGLFAIIVLLIIVLTGYLYAWKKKALEWK
jgi:NADH-quinone oxidoreductase subunit A